MSSPFLGQISIYAFNFAPRGFALCNGQVLSINQNQALFSLLGTTYGGDGRTTFALPNLQGDVAIHTGNGFILGQRSSEASHTASHTLLAAELPAHVHGARHSNALNVSLDPTGRYWAPDTSGFITFATTPTAAMSPQGIGPAGGSQPHDNMAPYLTINFCIALQGIFPSRN